MPTEITSLFFIAAKSIAVYVFILLAIRLFGKKELAQLSVIDLVFILLISNSVQNAMVGTDSSLIGGLAAATGLFFINYIFKIIDYKFPKISKKIQGEKIMLIYEGKVQDDCLKQAMITFEELEAAVREHGVQSVDEVTLAVLEADGNISVVSDSFKTKTQKKRKIQKALLRQE